MEKLKQLAHSIKDALFLRLVTKLSTVVVRIMYHRRKDQKEKVVLALIARTRYTVVVRIKKVLLMVTIIWDAKKKCRNRSVLVASMDVVMIIQQQLKDRIIRGVKKMSAPIVNLVVVLIVRKKQRDQIIKDVRILLKVSYDFDDKNMKSLKRL